MSSTLDLHSPTAPAARSFAIGITLSADELEALTGYQQPTRQLQLLHARGFLRAFISRKGGVVLERALRRRESWGGSDRLEREGACQAAEEGKPRFLGEKRMTRSRDIADGLPYRVYEYYGKLRYSIGFKMKSGRWAFRYACASDDKREIAKLRKKAILESAKVSDVEPVGSSAPW